MSSARVNAKLIRTYCEIFFCRVTLNNADSPPLKRYPKTMNYSLPAAIAVQHVLRSKMPQQDSPLRFVSLLQHESHVFTLSQHAKRYPASQSYWNADITIGDAEGCAQQTNTELGVKYN